MFVTHYASGHRIMISKSTIISFYKKEGNRKTRFRRQIGTYHSHVGLLSHRRLTYAVLSSSPSVSPSATSAASSSTYHYRHSYFTVSCYYSFLVKTESIKRKARHLQ